MLRFISLSHFFLSCKLDFFFLNMISALRGCWETVLGKHSALDPRAHRFLCFASLPRSPPPACVFIPTWTHV